MNNVQQDAGTPAPNPAMQAAGRSQVEYEQLVRETAYLRYVARGYTAGHELEDWYEAEAEVLQAQADDDNNTAPAEMLGDEQLDIQQSSAHGAWQDDALKQMVRQHPARGISQVEGIEPGESPPHE